MLRRSEEEIIIAVIEGEKLQTPEDLTLLQTLENPVAVRLVICCGLSDDLRAEAGAFFEKSSAPTARYALELLRRERTFEVPPDESEEPLIQALRRSDACSMIRLCRAGAAITSPDTVLHTVARSRLSQEGVRFLFKYGMSHEMQCRTLMTLIDEEERKRHTPLADIYCSFITVMANLFLEECRQVPRTL